MAMFVETVTTYTCDLCGNTCGAHDGMVRVQVDPGDGRDVGPGHMVGEFKLFLPYRSNNGEICEACTLKFLRQYVAAHSDTGEGREGA